MKLWLPKSLYDILFLMLNTILFLSSERISIKHNENSILNKNLKNEISSSDSYNNNVPIIKTTVNDKNENINFDFTLKKSTIKTKRFTVGDLIHMNYDKTKNIVENKKNENLKEKNDGKNIQFNLDNIKNDENNINNNISNKMENENSLSNQNNKFNNE